MSPIWSDDGWVAGRLPAFYGELDEAIDQFKIILPGWQADKAKRIATSSGDDGFKMVFRCSPHRLTAWIRPGDSPDHPGQKLSELPFGSPSNLESVAGCIQKLIAAGYTIDGNIGVSHSGGYYFTSPGSRPIRAYKKNVKIEWVIWTGSSRSPASFRILIKKRSGKGYYSEGIDRRLSSPLPGISSIITVADKYTIAQDLPEVKPFLTDLTRTATYGCQIGPNDTEQHVFTERLNQIQSIAVIGMARLNSDGTFTWDVASPGTDNIWFIVRVQSYDRIHHTLAMNSEDGYYQVAGHKHIRISTIVPRKLNLNHTDEKFMRSAIKEWLA